MKGLFKVTTKTIVATGLGAALFTLLFMFVKIPSPIPQTSLQTAYGLGAFFAVLFLSILEYLLVIAEKSASVDEGFTIISRGIKTDKNSCSIS